jgi:Cu(I)/Ag(I) efflux system protein CusF
MKRIALFSLILLAPLPGIALADPAPVDAAKQTEAAPTRAVGVVKKADPAKGSVTLAHEAIPSLGWPAMTMGFKVRDPALFGKLQVERKVEFEFVKQPDGYVVTAVK